MNTSRSKRSSRGLSYEVRLHPEVSRYLVKLGRDALKDAERRARTLRELAKAPFTARPSVDIAPWQGAEFDHRLRRGRHRFGYRVDKRERVVCIDAAWFK
jgi:mRNA-degrading endonuclease RelE of RelBE toxin-antitoxin system